MSIALCPPNIELSMLTCSGCEDYSLSGPIQEAGAQPAFSRTLEAFRSSWAPNYGVSCATG